MIRSANEAGAVKSLILMKQPMIADITARSNIEPKVSCNQKAAVVYTMYMLVSYATCLTSL